MKTDEEKKEARRKAQKKYRMSCKGRTALKKYNSSEKGKACREKYAATEKGNAARLSYSRSANATRKRRAWESRNKIYRQYCAQYKVFAPVNDGHRHATLAEFKTGIRRVRIDEDN